MDKAMNRRVKFTAGVWINEIGTAERAFGGKIDEAGFYSVRPDSAKHLTLCIYPREVIEWLDNNV